MPCNALSRMPFRPFSFLLLSGALALLGCSSGADDEADNDSSSATPVRVALAERATVVETERSLGRSEALSDPYVAAEVGGRVVRVHKDVGDRVDAGDVLAEIERERYESALSAAEAEVAALDAELEQLQRDLERMTEVAEGGYVSDSELEGARTELESARERREAAMSERDEARRQLRETEIRAPFAGRVDARELSEGDSLSAGEPAFRLVPETAARVRLPFPEQVIGRLAEGMPARLRRLDSDDDWLEGEVTRLRPSVDEGSGGVAVVEFEAPETWPLGALLEALVEVDRREGAIQVPAGSVVDRPGRQVVYVVPGEGENAEVEEREVSTGYHSADVIEILDGVDADERVVVDGADFLSDGTEVRVQEAD
ncbi:efflux RND transporter periplasmic adaptor subunit [Marinimicrobium alkaliphilum]|uniref:efflux RND transporter periplasmic adaptor subunit n=1 Tax=Marinimicrobium alkaliphilum TaxID=2202654 RepID=UPI000DB9A98B|nr:efflux RND transporter periplasmic adaptor subunit [Marinimicrobium alkaliphilum]